MRGRRRNAGVGRGCHQQPRGAGEVRVAHAEGGLECPGEGLRGGDGAVLVPAVACGAKRHWASADGSRDGLVHISELAPQRVKQTSDVVNVGDQVKVKVLGVDDRGKVKLSMKAVDQKSGEDLSQRADAAS